MKLELELSAPANLRDLGGLSAGEGHSLPRVALRSDDLSLLREQDADELLAGGLVAVVDLRTELEVRNTGRGVLAERAVSYHHVPLMSGLGKDGPAARVDPHDASAMGQLYTRLYTEAADRIVTVLALIAYSSGATAFYCSAGKDRTGIVAAALLLAVGASDDTVLQDYARTGDNGEAVRQRLRPALAPVLAETGLRNVMTRRATRSDFSRVPMQVMLDSLRDRHDDPLAPLRAAGLDDGLQTALRRRFVGGMGRPAGVAPA